MTISHVNRDLKIAVTDDNRSLPVTNWFDIAGDECDPDLAMTCVAGKGDEWFSVDLSQFENVTAQ